MRKLRLAAPCDRQTRPLRETRYIKFAKFYDFATCALLPLELKVKTLMLKRYLGRLGKFETEPGEQNLRFTATSVSFFAHVLSAKFTFAAPSQICINLLPS